MSGLFSISRTALIAHQRAMETISHNIANAETPGYSRQEALLEANTPVNFPFGSVGTGVSVHNIIRKRSIMLDDAYRSANATSGQTGMRRDLMKQLEGVFGEPSDAGLTTAFDNFFNAWSELATSPGNATAKDLVRHNGKQLAQLLNNYDLQLTQQRNFTIDRLTNTVAEINLAAQQVADLNYRIKSAESGGTFANDLRDQRDLLLDQLSKVAGARAIPQTDGTVSVIVGNSTLVDSNTARPLSLDFAVQSGSGVDIPVRVRLGQSPDALQQLGGELQAMVQYLNTDIPSARARLDAIAAGIVSAVNAEHTQGFVFNGGTIPGTAAGDFFDPGSIANPVTAGTIRLSDDVAASSSAIAISRDANAQFDNAGALAIAGLRELAGTVSYVNAQGVTETGTFVGFFRTMVSRIGLDVKLAQDESTVQQTMVEQADLRRQSVSGVNLDEELMQMLRVQQSYTAATKMIKAADDMLQTLLSLV